MVLGGLGFRRVLQGYGGFFRAWQDSAGLHGVLLSFIRAL